ncbi:MAG: hypothetical protein K6A62_09770 [Bacteroidales bacterium]|nr:hypothetical protein [Bacteroidales bacterium]
MKKTITILTCLFLLIACTPYGITKVNLKKAFRQKTAAKDLYSRVEVKPLRLPETVALPEAPRMDAAGKLLFLPDVSGEQIVVLDTDGSFVTLVGTGEPISAFSACGNMLDVLCGSEVKEYSLPDFSLTRTLSLPTDGVTLTGMQRVDEDALWFWGNKEGKAYDGVYFFARDHFSLTRDNIFHTPDQSGNFFRCNDTTFFFLTTGRIFVYDAPSDFVFVPFTPDFGKHEPEVTAAQMTTDHLYMQMRLREQDLLLVYDRAGERHRLFRTTTEGLVFPLGVIRGGVNYYCSPARKLKDYVSADAPESANYYLLKYTL